MDCLNKEQRRKAMQANKSKNTKIEISLCKALWKQGIRYRKNFNKLLGAPDIAITKYELAIFCDGDFWHGNNFDDKRIKTNQNFWNEKIKRNKERDLEVTLKLRDEGWTVLRFWESDIKKNLAECVEKIKETIINIREKRIRK